jgi:hypothetical protein
MITSNCLICDILQGGTFPLNPTGRQDGDDRDHDQQFNQGKAGGAKIAANRPAEF